MTKLCVFQCLLLECLSDTLECTSDNDNDDAQVHVAECVENYLLHPPYSPDLASSNSVYFGDAAQVPST